jgi:ribosome-binding factor A
MSSTRRPKRLAALLQSTLSRVLLEEVSDPALREVLVTEVDISPDLKHAKVYFSQREPRKEKELTMGFQRAMPFLKRRISEELELRYIPELRFTKDSHTDELNHLLSVMKNVEEGGAA